jgi:hypothetical protein
MRSDMAASRAGGEEGTGDGTYGRVDTEEKSVALVIENVRRPFECDPCDSERSY